MSYVIQNIFSNAYDRYRASASVSPEAHKTAVSILSCKTALLGGNSAVCKDCGAAEVHYNSCRNRHCPCCQAMNKEKWIDARKADVVDAPYFHAVFTVPEQLNSLFLAKEWIPHLKETFKGAANVIEYLGRYTHNIAISNSRILKVTDQSVSFRIKDYRTGHPSTLILAADEFIRRFLMHVLPGRFVRIRHYGLLSNRSKRKKMTLVRLLVGGVRMQPKFKDMTALEILKKLYAIDPGICRNCGGNHLKNTTLPSSPKLE